MNIEEYRERKLEFYKKIEKRLIKESLKPKKPEKRPYQIEIAIDVPNNRAFTDGKVFPDFKMNYNFHLKEIHFLGETTGAVAIYPVFNGIPFPSRAYAVVEGDSPFELTERSIEYDAVKYYNFVRVITTTADEDHKRKLDLKLESGWTFTVIAQNSSGAYQFVWMRLIGYTW